MEVTIGATLTGGTAVTLHPAGLTPGRAVLAVTGSTRLVPKTVEFTSAAPVSKPNDPGTARTGLKVSFANREVEEGCCTVSAGTVIMDLGIRWPLSQPEAVVDDVIAYLRGLVYTTEFVQAVKAGILPQ